ncbi:hypothetical protein [Sphingomonas sp. PB2P12]|uniref:hypothetical protein n=1 Tax=Sphingomonas sandaracina TaxID=3096157 RepID=UPI002FC5A599
MTMKLSASRLAVACLLFSAAPAWAGERVSCLTTASKPRLVCDEGACVRVSVRDLCDVVRASYPSKRRIAKPVPPVGIDPVRNELTMLIASVS